MRKKRTFIGLAIIVAMLMLGVGYAAVSGINLKITGSASAGANQDNFKVVFNSNVVTDKTQGGATANVSGTASNLAATIDVSGLTTTGQYVTATYQIDNTSTELGANLALGKVENNNPEYFRITPTLKATSIAHGANTTVTVKVELIKTPIADQNATITVPITATATVS